MKSYNILFAFSLIFGVIALGLWVARFYTEIPILYPISFNVVQFALIILMKNRADK
jgi:uncharacterized membrane protein YiaA